MRYRVAPMAHAMTLAVLRDEGGEAREGSPPVTTEAWSPQHEQIKREMLRYVRGETGGRAYLVSGAQGVGKTTLVMNALQETRRLLAPEGLRPVLVQLEAPTLLMPAPARSRAEAKPGEAKPAEPSGQERAFQDMEIVLRRATVALFQSLEEEVWRALLRRARDERLRPPGVSQAEMVEMASRLRAELGHAPTLSDLRDLWERAGLLQGGGLFGHPADAGHGLREVLALWTAVRAYHVASDTVVGHAEQGHEEQRSAERSLQTKWAVREILNPVLGLFAGGLVGVSVYELNGLLAAVLGTIAALITGAALDMTVRHFKAEKQLLTYKVTLDTSPYALSRLLPQLVTHLRETGLAPVFIVDELNKVKRERERLDELMSHLKSFVAEDAFFCFLTDRDFYELLIAHKRHRKRSASMDSFTDHLYVCYRPSDLREWLKDHIRPEPEAGERADGAELAFIVTALLGQTRMRVQELNRRLRATTDEAGVLQLPVGGPRASPTWVVAAQYQASLEEVLADPGLVDCIGEDPHTFQLALDLLLWPIERWSRHEPLLVGPDALEAVLAVETDMRELGAPLGEHAQIPGPLAAILLDALKALARHLANPEQVAHRPEFEGLTLTPILERDPDDEARYVWRLNRWGQAVG